MQSDQNDMKSAVGSVICTVGHKRSAQNSRLRFFNYFPLCNREGIRIKVDGSKVRKWTVPSLHPSPLWTITLIFFDKKPTGSFRIIMVHLGRKL